MSAIKNWFNTEKQETESCGSGIYIMDNGVPREITLDEWKRLNGEENSNG